MLKSGPRRQFVRVCILKTELIAEIVKWGIRQNPFKGQLPRKTVAIMDRLNTIVPDFIETTNIRAYVKETIEQVPEIREWNLSQVEYARGVKVDDPARPPFSFSSRYGGPNPEHDFIDLDALAQNIASSLAKEAMDNVQ